jgi:hypothetical protein
MGNFALDLQEGYKRNKKLLYAVMRNKTKPKTELCSKLGIQKVGLDTRCLSQDMDEHFMELLNA